MSKPTKNGGIWSILQGIVQTPKEQTPAPSQPTKPTSKNTTHKKKAPTSAEKTYKVTGTRHYLDNLLPLAVENKDYYLDKRGLIRAGLISKNVYQYNFFPTKAEVIPEPENPHDPKAIKVMVDGRHVGYIKAGSCAHLLKVIQEGRVGRISCTINGGKYKSVYPDDYDDNEKETYVLEKDEAPFFVKLEILEL